MIDTDQWSMADMLRGRARAQPAHSAVVFEGRTTTYGQLDAHTSRVAQGLIAFGIAPGARTAVLDFNSDRYVEVYFGTVKARATMVGINARLAPPEVVYVANDAHVEVLFVGAEHYALVEGIERELRTVRHIVALDGGHSRWPAYAEWRDAQSARDPGLAADPDDDCIQLYTSGTTGHPKGVCHTHRTWGACLRAVTSCNWGRYDSSTVLLICMPQFHVAGFNMTCFALNAGGTAVIMRKVDPAEILRLVPRHGVTDSLWVPAIMLAILSLPQAADTDFSSLRTISYGAAPIAADLLDQAQRTFRCGFVHLYGLTENAGCGTQLSADMHDPKLGKLRTVGKPYPGLELRVVDAEGKDLPPGKVGEIVMRAPWTMRGYWRNPEATRDAVREGWLHSGDAGYLDEDGYLYIFDRVKDMIITGGENVYPAEVENALFGHADVADVAVIGVPDEKWGEAVKAIVVPKPGAKLDVEDVLRFARTRIAGYKVPKSIDLVEALPRNASGKVLRRTLREPYWKGQERRVH
jgi:fatty-acyl-CoA synthase